MRIEEVFDTRFRFSFRASIKMEPPRIEFENGVLRFGTTFTGHAFNSEVETICGQSALAGNAADMAVLGLMMETSSHWGLH